jgi:HlyD family secretion protein
MRILTAIAIVAVLIAGCWFAWGYFTGGLPVEAARAERGAIQEFVDEEGRTSLPESSTHLITMPYAGRIAAIDLAEGAEVAAGQVVARIVPADLDLSLDAAVAAVDRARAALEESEDTSVEETSLEQTERFVESMVHTVAAAEKRVESGRAKQEYAEKYLARTTEAHERDAVADDTLDQAQVRYVEGNVDYQQDVLVHSALLAMKAATDLMPTTVEQYIARKRLTRTVKAHELAQAEIELSEAQRDHERGVMTSPVAGVVLSRMESDERYLAAGTPLLEIGRTEDLEVEADVLTQDAVALRVGAEVDIYGPAIGAEPVAGRVKQIYPEGFTKVSSLGVEQQRVKVVVGFAPGVLAALSAGRELGVDYRVNVKIYTAGREGALVVPRSALFRGAAGDWQVFAVRAGRSRLVGVGVGLLNDELAEIVEGLDEGDTVILAPETNLEDGTRVAPLVRGTEDR